MFKNIKIHLEDSMNFYLYKAEGMTKLKIFQEIMPEFLF